MDIGIIGATGNIGQRLLAEAIQRGHSVTAFTRDAARFPKDKGNVTWKTIDLFDPATVVAGLRGLDVVVSSYQPGNAARDLNDSVEQSIRNPGSCVQVARTLLKAMENYPRLRLIVMGGTASLEMKPGLTFDETTDELRAALREIGVPEAYEIVVRGHRDAFNTLRLSNRLWTYFSPALLVYPGERTGHFRIGFDQLMADTNGESRISMEDAAVAILDEIELPRFVQRRFTAAY